MSEQSWATIPRACKPSRATGDDPSRPILESGWIEYDEDGCWLIATDSYILARIPVHFDGGPETGEQPRELLPKIVIPQEAMRVLDSGSRFRVEDGYLRVEGRSALYALGDSEAQHPSATKIIRDNWREPIRTPEIFVNPKLIQRLTEAIGAAKVGVILGFTGKHKPIQVTWPHNSGERAHGLVMPIREARP